MLFVRAAPGCNLPNDFAPSVLFALFDTGVTGIGTDHVFFTVQRFVDLSNVGNVGRRDHYALHQTRLIIDADVGFGTEVY